MLEPEFLGLWTKLNKEGNGPIERAACWIYNNLPRIQNSKFKKNWFPHPKNQPNPKRCHAVYTMESFPIGRTISQNMYLAASDASAATKQPLNQNWVCRWNWWPQFTIWPSFKVALLVKTWLLEEVEEEETKYPLLTRCHYRAAHNKAKIPILASNNRCFLAQKM